MGFVTENEQELLKKLNTALNLQFGVDLESFTYDSKVPFFGKNIPIRQLLESGDCDNYFGDGAVYLKQGLSGMEIYEAVLGLIGKIAYKILKPKIDRYAELMDVKYSSLEIDDGRRTFGSFNDITKVIFLSRRLLMMSESVINFLIVHELAHGKHFTHDRNHEAVMGTILPEYEDCDRMFNAILLPTYRAGLDMRVSKHNQAMIEFFA